MNTKPRITKATYSTGFAHVWFEDGTKAKHRCSVYTFHATFPWAVVDDVSNAMYYDRMVKLPKVGGTW